MKAKIEKLVREPCELEIIGATLLTADEAEQLLTAKDRACKSWWWLRSPGDGWYYAAVVTDFGSVLAYGRGVNDVSVGVRPALRIANLASINLKIGDEFDIGGRRFRIISNYLALCNSIVGYSRFDAKNNDYERSEIKAFVDAWFERASRQEATC